jgi:hypothetical protein
MALDTELRATTYAGNGSTSLAYPILFPYLDSADIKVQVQAAGAATPTVLTESAYTVHDEEDDGAPYVTTTAAYPSTTTVQIFRFMDYLQPVVLPEGGKLSSVIIEQALDRVTMLAMQGGDGGYTLPSAGSRDSVVFANAGARATTVAARVGQLGVQTDNGSVWRALSTFAGDWQEIMPAIRSNERNVHTQSQLIAAFTDTAALTIYVRKDIDLSVSMTMGANKTLVMGDYRFTQVGASTLILMGVVVADRRQIFSGFSAGQIIGTFGGTDVFPEWWGLVPGYHDIAINCAVKASTLVTAANGFGIKVSLANTLYEVSAPIDMSFGAVTLEGAGSNLTYLRSTVNWTPTWIKAEVWGAAGDPPNHAAMIWIGSDLGTGTNRSFRSKVKGMEIECGNASFKWRAGGLLRVSGISSKSFVEECSVIEDVSIVSASGFGIGFCRHKAPGGAFVAAVVNGLSIRDFWITGPTFRDAYPMYFSQWTNNCSVDTGTIGPSLAKSISADYETDTSPANGGFDTTAEGTATYDEPAWIVTYPLTGIRAAGNLSVSNVHFEGMVIGVHCEYNNSGGNSIALTNLNFLSLHDPIAARGSVYINDGRSGRDFATDADATAASVYNGTNSNDTLRYFGYGCGVLISKGQFMTGTGGTIPYNYFDRVVINGIHGSGGVTYLLRDALYGKNITAYGMGQNPTSSGGGISFYSRGNGYANAVTRPYASITPGGGLYDPVNPTTAASTSRTFFVGPIF